MGLTIYPQKSPLLAMYMYIHTIIRILSFERKINILRSEL